ncbi:hypothetical protein KVR01_013555 [Diaporthe batatas]|uniref:uncharacterized protein n=1 Tax=Diaporthe batatas TaxID=748121 RepID=UPI001D039F1C|nr:uncharacterized protein KVR01_013555 [Diaporthe batatas]KAG8156604.1 hypothetical protein KVR01_013555 [Diaporthe batatas]
MRVLSLSLLCAQWLLSPVLGLGLTTHDSTFVPDHVLRISAKDISQACDQRHSAVVNGTSPGPAIRIRPGGSSWIRVYNDMEDHNLTMHWHGLAQRMAQFSDGAVLASQWPIPPMNYFDYEIEALPEDAGTYFYHSHVGMQALTVFGALIVEDCGPPPYQYDDERTLLWHEHYKQNDSAFEAGLLASPLVFGGEVQAMMLNGQGVAINHTAGEIPGDASCQLPVIEVEPDKTYRFRFIGATSLSHSIMAFEGHEILTVIAVDGGQYTQPAATYRMQLGSGQRFDVLLKTKSQADLDAAGGKTDYFIQFETRDRPAVYQGFGVLRYTSSCADDDEEAPVPTAPATAPFNLTTKTYDWLENTLQPLVPDLDFPTLEEVTRRVVVDVVQLTSNATGQIIWQLNGLNWNEIVAYPVPLLVDIYLRGEDAVPDYETAVANGGWDPKTKAYAAKVGEVLEIVFQNTGSLVNNNGGVDVHPFHAHGAHYYDLGSGNGTYDANATEAARVEAGYTPVKRDTTMLYRYETKTTAGADAGWRAWRIRINDPGVWMIHCHVLQHMVMGMQSVWVVGNASEIQRTPTELSQGYFTFGGSVTGNETSPPQVYEQFDHSLSTCPF